LSKGRQISAIRDGHVGDHLPVEGEHRGRRPKLRTHVTDSALACCTDRFGPWAKVLHNLVGPALHRQQTAQVENDVFRRSPAIQFSGQAHADQFRMKNLPRQTCHHFTRICAADTDRQPTQATTVRRM